MDVAVAITQVILTELMVKSHPHNGLGSLMAGTDHPWAGVHAHVQFRYSTVCITNVLPSLYSSNVKN